MTEMAWEERVRRNHGWLASRCEWCAVLLGERQGIVVSMPPPASAAARFCGEDCARKYDAAEREKFKHPGCVAEEAAQDAHSSPQERAEGDSGA